MRRVEVTLAQLDAVAALSAPHPPPSTIALRPLEPALTRTVHIHHRATAPAEALAEVLAAASRDTRGAAG